jgi:molybdopterin synthase catalytic subunit
MMDKKLFEVVKEPLSADEVAARVAAPKVGAIVTFIGTVRDHTGDRQVDYLEYEAYPEMAEPLLAQIGREAQERWPSILKVAIVHRVGRLQIGEASIVIAVAASHRQETFAACSYIIERVKAIVPIWKKEVWADGEVWIEGPRQPDPALAVAWADVVPFQNAKR